VRFRRLYDLSVNKHWTVEDKHVLGWEEGGEAWQWRRRLWDWEEMLVEECRMLLSNITLQVTMSDRWRWRLDTTGSYTVRSIYDMLTADGSNTVSEAAELIWNRHVPLKVSILAWRLLRNRLPTKANLLARGMLAHDVQLCVSGCGEVETAQHLCFLSHIWRVMASCPTLNWGLWGGSV